MPTHNTPPPKILSWIIYIVVCLAITIPIAYFTTSGALERAAQPPQHITLPPGTHIASLASYSDSVSVTSCVDSRCQFSLVGTEGGTMFRGHFGVIFKLDKKNTHYAILNLKGKLFEFSTSGGQTLIMEGNYRVSQEPAETAL